MPTKYSETIRGFFSQSAVADMITSMPAPSTPLTNMFFPANKQVQKASPFISIADVEAETGALPLVKRDSASIPAVDTKRIEKYIEVDPIKANKFVSAAELNNLIARGETSSLQAFVQEKVQFIRDRVSATKEVLVAQALTGKIDYPYGSDTGNKGKCEIDLGSAKTLTGAKLLTTSTLADLQMWLEAALAEHVSKCGSATQPVFLLASNVYMRVVEIITKLGSGAPVIWKPEGMNLLGKYDIRSLTSTYLVPGATTPTKIIADGKSRIIDLANAGTLFYASLDDIDANMAPLPFYSKFIDVKDPDGIKIIGESKPLPAFAMKRQSEQTIALA